jgi:hypothetical protein
LTSWEGSVTRRSNVMMSAEGEATPGRRKKVDDASWTDVNLTRTKMKKIRTVDLVVTNERRRFKIMMN